MIERFTMEELRELLYRYLNEGLVRLTISNPRSKTEAAKISLRPVLLGEKLVFQASISRDNKIFHRNLERDEAVEEIVKWMGIYRQLEVFSERA